MANVDAPFGLRPVRYLNGAPYNGQANKYYVSATDATALYIGDPVDFATIGTDATGMHLAVKKATLADGNYTIGPVVAVEPNVATDLIYRVASTERYVWVADDPNLVFECQGDSATAMTALAYGRNTILVETHAGSTVTGLSGIEVDVSGAASNSSNMLLMLNGANRPDNDAVATHAVIEVMLSMHRFKSTGDGDGCLGWA